MLRSYLAFAIQAYKVFTTVFKLDTVCLQLLVERVPFVLTLVSQCLTSHESKQTLILAKTLTSDPSNRVPSKRRLGTMLSSVFFIFNADLRITSSIHLIWFASLQILSNQTSFTDWGTLANLSDQKDYWNYNKDEWNETLKAKISGGGQLAHDVENQESYWLDEDKENEEPTERQCRSGH